MKKWILLLSIVLFPVARGDNLKIITINFGMLSVGNPVPYVKERQQRLSASVQDVINRTDFDIMSIQEVWTNESLKALENIDDNYRLITLKEDFIFNIILEHDKGLAFLVKKSLNVDALFTDYIASESYICIFGQVCDRGMLELRLNYLGKRISVINTHLTPYLNLFRFRKRQIQEIINYRDQLLSDGTVDTVILAGDLNFSPINHNAKPKNSKLQKKLQRNANLYNSFFLGKWGDKCIDTYDESLLPPNFSSTHNDGPELRIDHIFLCDRDSWSVEEVRWEFDRVYFENGKKFRISDHYGVYASLSLQ